MMKELRLSYPVLTLKRVLDVSASGYYAWAERPLSQRSREDLRLELEIKAADHRTKETYGPDRLQSDLAEHDVHAVVLAVAVDVDEVLRVPMIAWCIDTPWAV